jgi:hypothetical protein
MTEDQLRHRTLQLQRETLGETSRHNRAVEEVSAGTLAEQSRHNVATENIDLGKLGETTRHNKATEGIDLGKLSETVRHNQATENIDLGNLAVEQSRAAEMARHNQATETQTTIAQNIELGKLAETRRHNVSTENINAIYNDVWKAVQDRANELKAQGIRVDHAKMVNDLNRWKSELKESHRHNVVSEIENGVEVGTKVLRSLTDTALGLDKHAETLRSLGKLLSY